MEGRQFSSLSNSSKAAPEPCLPTKQLGFLLSSIYLLVRSWRLLVKCSGETPQYKKGEEECGPICAECLRSKSNLSFSFTIYWTGKVDLPHKFIWRTNELKVQAFWTSKGIYTCIYLSLSQPHGLGYSQTLLLAWAEPFSGCFLKLHFGCRVTGKGSFGIQRKYLAHGCGWHITEPGELLLLLAPFLRS